MDLHFCCDFLQKIYGSDTERSRWRDCISYVNDNMGNAVGRLFVKDHFDAGAKEVVWLDEFEFLMQKSFDIFSNGN